MKYDFDRIIPREGTSAFKFTAIADMAKPYLSEGHQLPDADGKMHGDGKDFLPLWIADMEFAAPDFILDAMRERLSHPIFGYTKTFDEMWERIINWEKERHGWEVKREWLTYIPGIVRGMAYVLQAFTKPGDKVIIQPPVYHPFRLVPEGYEREVVFNNLIEREDGLYEMDFEHLEKVCDDQCKVLILCNPHNPGGVCWSREVLQKVAHFAVEHNLIVISDEIHADMTLFGHKHIPFASVSEEAAQCSITFGAPSKVFNVPGVMCSWCVVPNADLRKKFFGWLDVAEFNEPSIFSAIATMTAYTPEGNDWRQQMLHYVEDNICFVENYCKENIPGVRVVRPEVSFPVWLDCRGLGLNHDDLQRLFIDKARLMLNDGTMFGPGGEGHMRLNVGTPRSILEEAMQRLAEAVKQL